MGKTVLFVDHADIMGGAEHSLLLLMQGLDRSRFEPCLAAPAGTPLARAARQAGISCVAVDMPPLRRSNVGQAALAWSRGVAKLCRLCNREGAALVHSNVMRASFYAAPAARRAGVPLVWHVRDIHEEKIYLWMMSAFASRIIAISRAVAERLPAWALTKTSLVPNGLDLTTFRPDPMARAQVRAEWGMPGNAFVIGMAGWLAPWKHPELFLEAAEGVASRYPQTHFLVIGDAAHPSYVGFVENLKHRAAHALGTRCVFTGLREDLPGVLAGMDVLVHTARGEPFGRILIEAMASGVPVIAFREGGPAEIVEDGETGFLVPPGDVPAIVTRLEHLIRDPALLQSMGEAGRRKAQQYYDARSVVARVEDIYEKLLSRSSR